MAIRDLLSLFALVLLLHQSHSQEPPGSSQPKAVTFSGNETFSSAELKSALMADPDFILASHPLAPATEFKELLRWKLHRGYLQAGFPDVSVTIAEKEGQPLQAQIVEGPRFNAGTVQVLGAKKIPIEPIISRLTKKYPPEEELAQMPVIPSTPGTGLQFRSQTDSGEIRGYKFLDSTGKPIETQEPVWEIGEPAPFGSDATISTRLEMILRDLGYLNPRFEVALHKPSEGNKSAELIIRILEEGQPAKLSDITIKGNSRNSREQILSYLNLSNGIPANTILAKKIEFQLYRSGHFKKAEALITPIPPDKARLEISLVESEHGQGLAKAYSRTELAFLKFRDWLDSMIARGDALSGDVQVTGNLLASFLISPRDGFLASFKTAYQDGPSSALLLSSNMAGIFSPHRKEKYFVRQPQIATFASVALTPSEDPETTSTIELGAGFRSRDDLSTPSFKLMVQLAPAPFIAHANHTEATITFTNDVLEMQRSNLVLRFDENSGKLLHLASTDGKLAIELQDAKKITNLLQAAESYTNLYDSNKPYSTFLSFFSREAIAWSASAGLYSHLSAEDQSHGIAAMQKLISPEMFHLADVVFASLGTERRFYIPWEGATDQNALAALIAGFVFTHVNNIFPENSWIWTVTRETVFVLKGNQNYTGPQLETLYNSEDMGPIGFYLTARLLTYVDPALARQFAARGLTRLSPADFAHDYKLLFQGDTLIANSLKPFLQNLLRLDNADFDSITKLFPAAGPLLKKAATDYKTNPEITPLELLTPLLDQAWQTQWRSQLQTALTNLATPL